ncbi:MAG: right-handed parallel beta-helix repeat-containing protein [Thermoplasmatota archaeon]
MSNLDLNMNASIYVNAGATLIADNVNVRWGGTSDGQYGLYVASGATLIMTNCNLTALDKDTFISRPSSSPDPSWEYTWGYHWQFLVEGNLDIQNCDLSYLWGPSDTGYLSGVNGGLQLFSDNTHTVKLNNVKIYNTENCGIYVGSGPSTIGSTTWSSNAIIHNTTVDNSTGPGIVAVGNNVKPNVENCTFRGNNYKGGNYYYGAAGYMANCSFINNKIFGFSFDPIDETSMMTIKDSFFNNNYGSGYRARRGGIVLMERCDFNGNSEFGIDLKWKNPVNPTDTHTPKINFYGGNVKNNGWHGIGPTWEYCKGSFTDLEISGNRGHGVITNSSFMDVSFSNCYSHDNEGFGFYLNGSKGTFSNNRAVGNRLGGIMISNESTAIVRGNRIDNTGFGENTGYGIYAKDTVGTIILNTVENGRVGIELVDSQLEAVYGNSLNNNLYGMIVRTDDFILDSVDMKDNSGVGIFMDAVTNLQVKDCTVDGSAIGISMRGGGNIRMNRVDVTGASEVSLRGFRNTDFTIENSTISGTGTYDVILNEDSHCMAMNTTIGLTKVNNVDQLSSFTNYWLLSADVIDNVTKEPVPRVNFITFSKNEDHYNMELSNKTSSAFGSVVNLPIKTYQKIGYKPVDEFNPVQITAWKEDYVPYIGDFTDMVQSLYLPIEIAVNQPPVILNGIGEPVTTHQKRPTITWTAASDWNSDDIKYNLNVYQDGYSGEHILIDEIVDTNSYQFEKNLRFHHVFYVDIIAFDPWGLIDFFHYEFETVNALPSAPVIDVLANPVSRIEDIVVIKVSESVDTDVDPVDTLSYLVEFKRMEDQNTGVTIQSGSNWTLSSDLFNENDVIRVIVKAFDGIEYGPPAMVNVTVKNFLPIPVSRYIDIEMEEDTPLMEVMDLNDAFIDKDGDDMQFRVKLQKRISADIDPITGILDLMPEENWNGEDYLLIEGMDSRSHGNEPWQTVRINVTVTGINDPPVFRTVNNKEVSGGANLVEGIQESQITIIVGAFDEDLEYDDELTYSTNFLDLIPAGLFPEGTGLYEFEENTGRMEIYLPNELVGTTEFNITVIDQAGLESDTTIRLIVENKNDPPERPSILSPESGANITVNQFETVSFTASAFDDPDLHIPDSDEELTYFWDFGDGTGEVEGEQIQEHEFTYSSVFTVTLKVVDKQGVERSSQIEVSINVIPIEIVRNEPEDEGWFQQYGLMLILIIVVVIAIIGILFFVFRKEPLAEIAEIDEKEHEELMAKQQADALKAQEQLALLMGGYEAAGPALPAAGPEGAGYDALPAAEGVPPEGMAPPEGYEQPPMEPAPDYDQGPPVVDVAAAPMPEYPAPEPAPPQPPAPEPAPQPSAPEPAPVQPPAAGMTPPPAAEQPQTYLPPTEENQ